MGKFAKRPQPSVNGANGDALADTGIMGTRYPAVAEYLLLDRWDDGEHRRTSTLLLFCEAGRWNVCLNDREAGRSAWSSGATPEDALDALEDALVSESASWRASRPPQIQNRRK